ncbi:MAG: hypothetical protein DME97_13495 [Verrucomicrobia bacterium]|nr:MAG: hypothetical protein DME97_13495 [Verrucomicrobiota bacterium]
MQSRSADKQTPSRAAESIRSGKRRRRATARPRAERECRERAPPEIRPRTATPGESRPAR